MDTYTQILICLLGVTHVHLHKCTHLTEVDIKDSVDNGEGKLGSVDGEEPLGGVHVCLYST